MSFKTVAAACSVSLLAVACGSNPSRGDAETSAKVPVIPGLVGKWKLRDCSPSAWIDNVPTIWSMSFIEFLGNGQMVSRGTDYDKEGCDIESQMSQFIATDTYKVVGSAADGTYQVDSDGLKIEYKTVSAAYAKTASENKFYGFDGWKAGTLRDITKVEMDGSEKKEPRGGTEYLLFKVKGDTLFLPDSEDGEYDGSTAAKRPRKVDEEKSASRMK